MENIKIALVLLLVLMSPGCRSNGDERSTSESIKTVDALNKKLRTLKVITSMSDEKHNTQSVLLGNDIALENAKLVSGRPGAFLMLATWNSGPDKSWFGGIIPSDIKSLEILSVKNNLGKLDFAYSLYEGRNLLKRLHIDKARILERAMYIIGRRASVMP